MKMRRFVYFGYFNRQIVSSLFFERLLSENRKTHYVSKAHNMAAPRNQRVVLTPKLAKEIYARKLEFLAPKDFYSCFNSSSRTLKGRSVPVAKMYNVSAKTIRDIWNRRTWTFATSTLWLHERIETVPNAFPVHIQVLRLELNCALPSLIFCLAAGSRNIQMPHTFIRRSIEYDCHRKLPSSSRSCNIRRRACGGRHYGAHEYLPAALCTEGFWRYA